MSREHHGSRSRMPCAQRSNDDFYIGTQFKFSCVIGVPSTTLPLMALFLYERTTPPPAAATPLAALAKIDELEIRTSEPPPLERMPFWKLALIVSRSTMIAIVLTEAATIPLP